MEQKRTVDTPGGQITYFLSKRKVKNLNLRVERTGRVAISIPERYSARLADDLVLEKWDWILEARAKQLSQSPELLPLPPPRPQCFELLKAALDRAYPLAAPLGVAMPELKIRAMTSQWGNCHWRQGYITLNTALARCPEYLRDYVALHELVHFLHHDHGPGFYQDMDALMPGWREYRKELKRYVGALAPRTE